MPRQARRAKTGRKRKPLRVILPGTNGKGRRYRAHNLSFKRNGARNAGRHRLVFSEEV